MFLILIHAFRDDQTAPAPFDYQAARFRAATRRVEGITDVRAFEASTPEGVAAALESLELRPNDGIKRLLIDGHGSAMQIGAIDFRRPETRAAFTSIHRRFTRDAEVGIVGCGFVEPVRIAPTFDALFDTLGVDDGVITAYTTSPRFFDRDAMFKRGTMFGEIWAELRTSERARRQAIGGVVGSAALAHSLAALGVAYDVYWPAVMVAGADLLVGGSLAGGAFMERLEREGRLGAYELYRVARARGRSTCTAATTLDFEAAFFRPSWCERFFFSWD